MPSHMFTGASIGTISGGTFVEQLENSALDSLSVAAAHSALHDAPARTDESRCHQHTRTNVLDKLERWAQGKCDGDTSVFWLHGGAGSGKSAVMQTLAEGCVAQGVALGSFFFSRSDPTRSSAEVVIPTLAYQLAQSFSSSLHVLQPIINGDLLIFKKSFRVQLLSLLVRPIQHLIQLGTITGTPHSPRVFIIDGLDECSDTAEQHVIIQAVAVVCHEYHIPVKFLISSRPEHAISTSFEWYKQENRDLGTISLSEDPNAEDDIRRFIEEEFLKICSQHPFRKMIPLEWPYLYDINRLVWNASSHFIYASTAMKYIWTAKENPARSLQVVLGLEVSRTGSSPFPVLDALYHHILTSACHRDQVLQIVAHCVYTPLPNRASMVCMMLDCPHDDLRIYLADMSPLVAFPGDREYYDEEVKILHASLGDFLRDPSRSGSLHLNKAIYLASTLEHCFQLLNLYGGKPCTIVNWTLLALSKFNLQYFSLKNHVISIIKQAGHRSETQEVLRSYSLCSFYECRIRFGKNVLEDFSLFFHAVHSIKTEDGLTLLPSYMEDFFYILETYINLESTPLGPAILPLIFSGYPSEAVCAIHSYHSRDNPSYRLIADKIRTEPMGLVTTLDVMTTAELASVRNRVNASPERLALAGETILEYLTNQVNLPFLNKYSAHKAWLRRTKPGKHIASGAPRLASVIHTLSLDSLRQQEDPDYTSRYRTSNNYAPHARLLILLTVLRPRYGPMLDWQGKVTEAVDLLKALLWLLPKAGFSEKIILYSKTTFLRNMYQRKPGLIHRVRKYLDRYTTRMRNAKLAELGRRIANGDINAVIEKSRMFDLDTQD